MTMKKISVKDQNVLCASLYINCYKRVIEELVYNSLDAGSSSIAIRVCHKNNVIKVIDNGIGISKNDFKILGEKYATNKFSINNLPYSISETKIYGYKGMSLACIIELSENVTITSKCEECMQETWVKTFCKGIYDQLCLTTSRPSRGTTVEISGFLYNRTVQQKSIDLIKELNNIKHFLEQLTLIHFNVSMSLRDDSRNEIIFKIHKTRDLYQTLWSLFEISRNDVQDLQVEKNLYKVKAYISKSNDKSKKYHWIYINGRILSNSVIHMKINEIMSKKLLKKTRNKKLKEQDRFYDECSLFSNNIPFYFIFLSCPNSDFDIKYNHESTDIVFKNWEEINRLIDKLIKFYCGDVSKLNYGIPSNLDKPTSKENNNTRKKVKEIMEKILNDHKQNKISHLPNGVNGKQIKRNMKKIEDNRKQKLKLLMSNEKIRSNIKLNDSNTCNNVNSNKVACVSKKSKDKYKKNFDSKYFIPCEAKLNKGTLECKQRICTSKLLQKFQNPSESVKRRCKKLSNEVQYLLRQEYLKYSEISFNEGEICAIIPKQIKNSTNFTKEDNKHIITHSKQKSDNIYSRDQARLFNNCNKRDIKKSYDLINTMMYFDVCPNLPEKKTSTMKITSRECTLLNEPVYTHLTFNSHIERNQRYFNRITHKRLSSIYYKKINKKVIMNNYIDDETDDAKSYHNKLYKQFSSSNNNKINKKTMYNHHIELNNKNIDFKNITGPILNSFNTYVNTANTYTIDILNSLHNINNEVNKTYSVKVTAKSTFSEAKSASPIDSVDTIKVDCALANNSKEKKDNSNKITNNLESMSEFEISNNTLEPLGFCEAILSANSILEDFERSFDTNFLHSKNIEVNKCLANDNGYASKENISQYFHHNEEGYLNNYQNTEKSLNIHIEKELYNTEYLTTPIDNIYQSKQEALAINTNIMDEFIINSRHSFVPKGMSQIFKNKYNKNFDILKLDKEYYEDNIYKVFAEDILNKFHIFEPNVKNVNDNVTKELIKFEHKIKKDNSNLIFDSKSLQHAQILGQVDQKFIAVRIKGRLASSGNLAEFIVLFDQHAVDERISLESNLSDYIDCTKWKSAEIDTITLKLSQEDLLYLYNYEEKFNYFGFKWNYVGNEILVKSIPKAIIGNNLRKADVIFAAVKSFILEQIEVLKLLKGNVSLYPKSIMQLVFNEACRYAIKFGDRLHKEDCKKMINSLANCNTPFQCAHGRPVMAVIMELPNNIRDYKVNINYIEKFKQKFNN